MFPKDFFWGAATSSHQVEGDNTNNDWWDWEESGKTREKSGLACKHYGLFKEDFDLAKKLNHNCHRFSIEWSRVQPKENTWNQEAIEHYKQVVVSLKERNIEPIVTLHHFTNPLWLAKVGGWLNRDVVFYFQNYVEKITVALADKVKFWITINEPVVYVYNSYLRGIWPPGLKSLKKASAVFNNLVSAHIKAYQKIHQIAKIKNFTLPKVSIAKNMRVFTPCQEGISMLNNFSAHIRDYLFNFYFLNKVKKYLDFLGINYYTRDFVLFSGLLGKTCSLHGHGLRKNGMGWEIYPEGLYQILHRLKKYKLKIFITENGTYEEDDHLRWEFILDHLKQLEKAIDSGIPIIGYLYWSLMDNFEWEYGFQPRFGLIGVNYKTFSRNIRDSAFKFAEVCRLNKLS